ncbi:MAG: hypothetical protein B6242_06360 [Anaerolineaceae bacterium 4572_78]|nr:MAG: hypothetical protein B6242_06360 [Anaerolineaceae bacterium 4572_78]
MEKIVLNFSECTLLKLDKLFQLKLIRHSPNLDAWLNNPIEISGFEKQTLHVYQRVLRRFVHDWHEVEL